MSWSATLNETSISPAGCSFSITYTDGVKKFRKDYVAQALSDDILVLTARVEIESILSASASPGKVTIQQGAQIDVSQPDPVPPSSEELARAKFMKDLASYRQILRVADLGLIQPDDPRIGAGKSTIQAEWLDEYMSIV